MPHCTHVLSRRHLAAIPLSNHCWAVHSFSCTTATALVNELVEAKQNNQVRKLMMRWQKYELIALDEVGYVPLADIARSSSSR